VSGEVDFGVSVEDGSDVGGHGGSISLWFA
jgi:hypothetical protein